MPFLSPYQQCQSIKNSSKHRFQLQNYQPYLIIFWSVNWLLQEQILHCLCQISDTGTMVPNFTILFRCVINDDAHKTVIILTNIYAIICHTNARTIKDALLFLFVMTTYNKKRQPYLQGPVLFVFLNLFSHSLPTPHSSLTVHCNNESRTIITHHTTTTILWHFFRDYPGEPVPEENFWTLWCKGRLTQADTLTIRLGTTPSGLSSAHLRHLPTPSMFLSFARKCNTTVH